MSGLGRKHTREPGQSTIWCVFRLTGHDAAIERALDRVPMVGECVRFVRLEQDDDFPVAAVWKQRFTLRVVVVTHLPNEGGGALLECEIA